MYCKEKLYVLVDWWWWWWLNWCVCVLVCQGNVVAALIHVVSSFHPIPYCPEVSIEVDVTCESRLSSHSPETNVQYYEDYEIDKRKEKHYHAVAAAGESASKASPLERCTLPMKRITTSTRKSLPITMSMFSTGVLKFDDLQQNSHRSRSLVLRLR